MEKPVHIFPTEALLRLGLVHLVKTGGVRIDSLVKSPFGPLFVIPAKAGIQLIQIVLDSCFRRSDGFHNFLRVHQD